MTTTAKLYINNVVSAVRGDAMAWGLFDSETVEVSIVCVCLDMGDECYCEASDESRIPKLGEGWVSL